MFLTSAFVLLIAGNGSGASVIREDNRIYIEDRKGVRWDVTKAKELGFTPRRFQYGIGKDAFTPLTDKDFSDDRFLASSERVIGVAFEGDAHAYAVARLRHHEVANTTIAGKAIAAGY